MFAKQVWVHRLLGSKNMNISDRARKETGRFLPESQSCCFAARRFLY
jgi:hypothetical protein